MAGITKRLAAPCFGTEAKARQQQRHTGVVFFWSFDDSKTLRQRENTVVVIWGSGTIRPDKGRRGAGAAQRRKWGEIPLSASRFTQCGLPVDCLAQQQGEQAARRLPRCKSLSVSAK
jgi:hypothetical protein